MRVGLGASGAVLLVGAVVLDVAYLASVLRSTSSECFGDCATGVGGRVLEGLALDAGPSLTTAGPVAIAVAVAVGGVLPGQTGTARRRRATGLIAAGAILALAVLAAVLWSATTDIAATRYSCFGETCEAGRFYLVVQLIGMLAGPVLGAGLLTVVLGLGLLALPRVAPPAVDDDGAAEDGVVARVDDGASDAASAPCRTSRARPRVDDWSAFRPPPDDPAA